MDRSFIMELGEFATGKTIASGKSIASGKAIGSNKRISTICSSVKSIEGRSGNNGSTTIIEEVDEDKI